jgi:hypothetical protein
VSLRQRLDALEQVIQPGRSSFLNWTPRATGASRLMLTTLRTEPRRATPSSSYAGASAQKSLRTGTGYWLPQPRYLDPIQRPPEVRRKATPCSLASMIG